MINVPKLDYELKAAGIPIDGCNSNGDIWFRPEATDEQKELAKKILANHNPVWYVEERQKNYPSIGDQLDIIYWDRINGTNKWEEEITRIKNLYPKV